MSFRGSHAMLACAILLPVAACSNTPSPSGSADVTLQVVKQTEYQQVLAGLRGKVVVMDIWGEY